MVYTTEVPAAQAHPPPLIHDPAPQPTLGESPETLVPQAYPVRSSGCGTGTSCMVQRTGSVQAASGILICA